MTDPRALLDQYAAEDPADGDYGRQFRREQIAPEAFAALRAVLDLHSPCVLDEATVCGRCRFDNGEPERYPCRTVVAITTALPTHTYTGPKPGTS